MIFSSSKTGVFGGLQRSKLPIFAVWMIPAGPLFATTIRVASYNVDFSDQGNNNNVPAVASVVEAIGSHQIYGNAQPADYTVIDNAFNTQGASLAEAVANHSATITAQIAGGGSAVPEPATIGMLSIGIIGLPGRRGRHVRVFSS